MENIRKKYKRKLRKNGYFHTKPVFDEIEFAFIFGVTQKRITFYTIHANSVFIVIYFNLCSSVISCIEFEFGSI